MNTLLRKPTDYSSLRVKSYRPVNYFDYFDRNHNIHGVSSSFTSLNMKKKEKFFNNLVKRIVNSHKPFKINQIQSLFKLKEINEKKEKNIKLLKSFLKLDYNWNENNAEPFNKKLILKCIRIINVLNHQPEIFPTARNSIQFEYEFKNSAYLEIEVFQKFINIFLIEKNGGEKEFRKYRFQDLIKVVNNFYATEHD